MNKHQEANIRVKTRITAALLTLITKQENKGKWFGATQGGVNIQENRTYWKPDIDGLRLPFKGQNQVDSAEPKMTGTLVEFTPENVACVSGAADKGGSGNAITVAARIQPAQVWTALNPNASYRKPPTGLLRLKIRSRIKPATVGGRTSGSVRIPSRTARNRVLFRTARLAAHTPRKKESTVATTPVFNEIHNGL